MRPKVVCLCGSTRFRPEYAKAFYDEEHAGRIVLTVPCYKDDPCCKTPEDWSKLDALHVHKINMADEILVINPGGYVGESTRNEVAYARRMGKPIRWLESTESLHPEPVEAVANVPETSPVSPETPPAGTDPAPPDGDGNPPLEDPNLPIGPAGPALSQGVAE